MRDWCFLFAFFSTHFIFCPVVSLVLYTCVRVDDFLLWGLGDAICFFQNSKICQFHELAQGDDIFPRFFSLFFIFSHFHFVEFCRIWAKRWCFGRQVMMSKYFMVVIICVCSEKQEANIIAPLCYWRLGSDPIRANS